MTKRDYDINGFMKVDKNPISKVGVFPYLGSTISEDCEPNKIYNVFRSGDELGSQECIDSFKLLPWTNEHAMLGSEGDGLTPAEKKGVHGVIGEEVFFDGEYLRGNIKVFSEGLHDIIKDGKNELSCGYRCKYKQESGSFDGEYYDFVQHTIRGNHLATVEEGRMGPDVAVMDHKFTFDSKDIIMLTKEQIAQRAALVAKMKEVSLALDGASELSTTDFALSIAPLLEGVDVMASGMDGMPDKKKGKGMDKEEGGMDEEMDEEGMDEEEGGMDEEEEDNYKGKDKKKKSSGMDSNSIKKLIRKEVGSALSSALDESLKPFMTKVNGIESKAMDAALAESKVELYGEISNRIGAFNHSEQTLEQMQDYALDKFGLDCKDKALKGSILKGYFAASKPSNSYAADSSIKSGEGFANKYKKEV